MAIHSELYVPHLLGGQRRLRKAGLEREDALSRRSRIGLLRPEVLQLVGDVRDVGGTQVNGSFVGARVVVPFGQPKASLADVDEVRVGVLEVRFDAEGVQSAHADVLQIARDISDVCHGPDGIDALEERRKRRDADRRDRLLVHGRGVVVSHHSSGGVGQCRLGGGLLEESVQQLLVPLVHFVEGAP